MPQRFILTRTLREDIEVTTLPGKTVEGAVKRVRHTAPSFPRTGGYGWAYAVGRLYPSAT